MSQKLVMRASLVYILVSEKPKFMERRVIRENTWIYTHEERLCSLSVKTQFEIVICVWAKAHIFIFTIFLSGCDHQVKIGFLGWGSVKLGLQIGFQVKNCNEG